MDRIFVIPNGETKVINPNTGKPIPVDGAEVVKDKYFSRRIADGGLTIKEQSKKSKSKKGA